MKKASQYLLVLSVLLLCGCVLFYILRNSGSGVIRASILQSTVPATTEATHPEYPLDLNTATVAELMTLPGIGKTYAQSIVDYRQSHGAFSSVDELLNVPGIGQKRLDAISDYLIIGGSYEDTGSR